MIEFDGVFLSGFKTRRPHEIGQYDDLSCEVRISWLSSVHVWIVEREEILSSNV